MICTNRKTTLVDLPLTSAAIQGHLLQAYYCFTNVSQKILDIAVTSKVLYPSVHPKQVVLINVFAKNTIAYAQNIEKKTE